jgi:transcriptional regulator with XRE-family HTH domain
MAENFLKKIRIEKGKSQAFLAKEIGVSRALLCGFEKGKNGVSDEVLRRLANALGVTTTEIVTGSSEINHDELEGLAEAVEKAFEEYSERYDKKTIIKIGSELYKIISDFNSFTDESGKKEFKKVLKSKAIIGLAALCFLDSDLG